MPGEANTRAVRRIPEEIINSRAGSASQPLGTTGPSRKLRCVAGSALDRQQGFGFIWFSLPKLGQEPSSDAEEEKDAAEHTH